MHHHHHREVPVEAEGLMWHFWICCLSAALTCIPTVPCFPGSWVKDGNKEAPKVFSGGRKVCTRGRSRGQPLSMHPSQQSPLLHPQMEELPRHAQLGGERGQHPQVGCPGQSTEQPVLPPPSRAPEAIPSQQAGADTHQAPPAELKAIQLPHVIFSYLTSGASHRQLQ